MNLIGINFIAAVENASLLKFDFAVSWDEEYGMRFLVYKNKILEIAEGGFCWDTDLGGYIIE